MKMVVTCVLGAVVLTSCLSFSVANPALLQQNNTQGLAIETLLRDLAKKLESMNNVTADVALGSPCSCSGDTFTCSCCVKIPVMAMISPACAMVRYIPSSFSIEMSISFNGYQVFDTTFSAKNPPPMCFAITTGLEACLDLYDIYLDRKIFRACLRIQLKILVVPLNLKLGCFTIPLRSMYQEYMFTEMGIPDADTSVLDQWVMALTKASLMKRTKMINDQK